MTARLADGNHILIVCDGTEGADTNLASGRGNRRADAPEHDAAAAAQGRPPLINGVKRTIASLERELRARYRLTVLHPHTELGGRRIYATLPLPGYPEIEIATNPLLQTMAVIRKLRPDAIFNATTEGPLGASTTIMSRLLNWPAPLPALFRRLNIPRIAQTVSYHTHLDAYASRYIAYASRKRIKISSTAFRPLLRLLFRGAHRIMVPTTSVQLALDAIGLDNTVLWPRGVDSDLFRPLGSGEPNAYAEMEWQRREPLPVLLYFGRLALEKNVEDFLDMPVPNCHKVVVGQGPHREALERRHPTNDRVHFLGPAYGEHLAHLVRSANVVVFPSKTDTFGNVLTEAGASGVPVVGYDVPSPSDVIQPHVTGILVPQWRPLAEGVGPALALDRERCAQVVRSTYSWKTAADTLVANLQPIEWPAAV